MKNGRGMKEGSFSSTMFPIPGLANYLHRYSVPSVHDIWNSLTLDASRARVVIKVRLVLCFILFVSVFLCHLSSVLQYYTLHRGSVACGLESGFGARSGLVAVC